MNKKEGIFIPNKKRILKDKLGRAEPWFPEWERLNMDPIERESVEEDFMNEKRRRAPLGSRKSPGLSGSKFPSPPSPPSPPRTRAPQPSGLEQAWRGRPKQVQPKDYSQGDIGYQDVSEPPEPFAYDNDALGVDMSTVMPGQYCLVYQNEVYASYDKEEIETALENIMRSDPSVEDNDLMIFFRHYIKVGVSIE